MNLAEIEKQAKALMAAHGVGRLDFEWDRGKRRIGAMHYQHVSPTVNIPVKITLSKHYAALLTDAEINEVLLHEIAHAKTPGDGHGAKWKAVARSLGIQGDRCMTPSDKPSHSVEGKCQKCGHILMQSHRLPLRVYFHGPCGLATDEGLGIWYKNGVRVYVSDMPVRYRDEFAQIKSRETFRR